MRICGNEVRWPSLLGTLWPQSSMMMEFLGDLDGGPLCWSFGPLERGSECEAVAFFAACFAVLRKNWTADMRCRRFVLSL